MITAGRRDLPSGTVTFLFTDIEGSTSLLHELGAEAYADALAEHRRILRDAFTANGGVEVDTQGDAFFVAFPTADGGLRAAAGACERLASGPLRVRMGIHTGTPHLGDEGYVGADVHRAARIAAAGHGGQVLVSAATAALVGTEGLRDLGQHRLKDLSAPERIYQVGADDFPPLKSLHQTNLPVPATTFLGRSEELTELTALIRRDDIRLVTLTGPGGTGKTRLGLQAAGAVADAFEGGVWWVPLAPIRDPELVLDTAAKAIGAKDDLAEHIGDKTMLILFDNFEQVTAASSDVGALLERCPDLKLLVTSREPLRLQGEWEYAVDPLHGREAVALFETRALAARRDFQGNGEVREICARLDNLPLAIELAAARVKVLSPRALLERLEQRLPLLAGGSRDAPERQRTLRATIEWSYELLTADEQALFGRLSVFRGGCTLESAEAVVEADLDTLQSLVDKSLVRQRNDRFSMLETIREYAQERLEESGRADEVRRRHAEHFLVFAETADPHLQGDPAQWLDRLAPEHDNLRAAFDHLETAGETQLILRLAGALATFWGLRGHLAEGRRRLEGALAAGEHPTAARAKALNGATWMARLTGDPALDRRRAEEALALHTQLGNPLGAALSRYDIANLLAAERDWIGAKELLEKSVVEFTDLGEDFHRLSARRGLAWMYEELGDIERYRQLTEENLHLARSLGVKRIEARALGALAMLALGEGRLDDARSMMTGTLRIDRELGFSIFVAIDLARFAAILAARAQPDAAARLLARADAIRDEIGFTLESWAAEERDATLATVKSALDDAAFAGAWQEGRAMSTDEAVALALASTDDSGARNKRG